MNAEAARAEFELRELVPGDVPLVFSSWLKAYRHGGHSPNTPNLIYYTEHHKVVDALLRRSKVVLATNPADQDQIFGWCCSERIGANAIVHFLWTKMAFQKFGVASSLLEAARGDSAGMFHTHRTEDGDRWAQRHRSTFNPYLLGVVG